MEPKETHEPDSHVLACRHNRKRDRLPAGGLLVLLADPLLGARWPRVEFEDLAIVKRLRELRNVPYGPRS